MRLLLTLGWWVVGAVVFGLLIGRVVSPSQPGRRV